MFRKSETMCDNFLGGMSYVHPSIIVFCSRILQGNKEVFQLLNDKRKHLRILFVLITSAVVIFEKLWPMYFCDTFFLVLSANTRKWEWQFIHWYKYDIVLTCAGNNFTCPTPGKRQPMVVLYEIHKWSIVKNLHECLIFGVCIDPWLYNWYHLLIRAPL